MLARCKYQTGNGSKVRLWLSSKKRRHHALGIEYRLNANCGSFICVECSGLTLKTCESKSRAGGFPPPAMVILSQRKNLCAASIGLVGAKVKKNLKRCL
jgi:hypothetical protein